MTQQPAAVIDSENYTVTRTVHIKATPDRVWAAITRPDLITQWLGTKADLPELRVGAMGVFGFEGYGEFPVRIDEYDEPVVFAFTWGTPPAPRDGEPAVLTPQNSTQVRYTLVPDGDSTILSVVESGFGLLSRDPVEAMRSNRQGWTDELDELVAYLEGSA
ncbi:SRPBCC domain-containing protein [Cellulomonas sp. URHE0023]|uniref:SRPBCC domain-containing protein n=1 Tax=Cellulomonas sp. URHE0023 TaxID=1380354 RepID=UPI00068B732C|nr:SRPBCC domain-containing protein [Cellulomonas sp. URHE0023]